MRELTAPGWIVILNGAPRAGKTSIARAIQADLDGTWINLGVDVWRRATAEQHQPGIGLRPGGERPDLEPVVIELYQGLYAAIAAVSRTGLNVVVDVGHHDGYAEPRGIFPAVLARLEGLPRLVVGVRCPLETILARRGEDGAPPESVLRWQDSVHLGKAYDLELDTSVLSQSECAAAIGEALKR